MNILPLGTKGFIPTFGRHTASYLFYDENSLFLIDAGTGLSRLNEPEIKAKVSNYSEINIILSHYHLDHIAGLPYLSWILPGTGINFYFPSKPFVDIEGKDAVNRIINPPFFPFNIADFPNLKSVNEVESHVMEIGGHKFDFTRLNHDGGSMGIKIDGNIAYITDTVTDEKIIEFISDAKVVLHEVWMTLEEKDSNPDGAKTHSVFEEVLEMLRKSNVNRLIPIHLNPGWNEDTIEKIFNGKRVNDIEVALPFEGRKIVV